MPNDCPYPATPGQSRQESALTDPPPFVPTLVRPGQPLTAQGWNDPVDGIDAVHQLVRAAHHTVEPVRTRLESGAWTDGAW